MAEAGCVARPPGHVAAPTATKYPSHEVSELVGHDGGVMSVRFTATGAYVAPIGLRV